MKKALFFMTLYFSGISASQAWEPQDSLQKLNPSSPMQDGKNFDPDISGVILQNNTSYDLDVLVAWFCEFVGLEDVLIRVSYLSGFKEYEGMVIMQNPKLYCIWIQQDITNYLWVCLHELVHVKQYALGELKVLNKSLVSYKGKEIDLEYIDYKHRSYENIARWETLAYWKKFKKYLKSATHFYDSQRAQSEQP